MARPSLAIISDTARATDPRADPRNVALAHTRRALWEANTARQGWSLTWVDASAQEAIAALRGCDLGFIDLPLLLPAPYRSTFERSSQYVRTLDTPEAVERVLGLDRYLPTLLQAGIPTPRTALVPLDARDAEQLRTPQDIRDRLIERLYGALFEAGLDPHDGLFVRGFATSAKTRNPELFFARSQTDLEATALALIDHLRNSFEVDGLAMREFVEIERLRLPGPGGSRDAIDVGLECRLTFTDGRCRLCSFHGPFGALAEPWRQQLAEQVAARPELGAEALALGRRLEEPSLGLPPRFVADVAWVVGRGPMLIELNPLYCSGFNVPQAHARAVELLCASLAQAGGWEYCAPELEPDGPGVWTLASP